MPPLYLAVAVWLHIGHAEPIVDVPLPLEACKAVALSAVPYMAQGWCVPMTLREYMDNGGMEASYDLPLMQR